MTTAFGPGADPCCAFGEPQVDPDSIYPIFAGDAVSLPLTLLGPPTYGSDGVTVISPGAPVDMTGMTPGAEFLASAQQPGSGVVLTVSGFIPMAGQFTVTVPGRNQPGDLTSGLLAPSPAKILGPRIRVHYTDAAGQHTFGTFYFAVS